MSRSPIFASLRLRKCPVVWVQTLTPQGERTLAQAWFVGGGPWQRLWLDWSLKDKPLGGPMSKKHITTTTSTLVTILQRRSDSAQAAVASSPGLSDPPGGHCAPFPSLLRLREHGLPDSSSRTKSEECLRLALRIAQWAQADPVTLSEDQVRSFFIQIKSQHTAQNHRPRASRTSTAQHKAHKATKEL